MLLTLAGKSFEKPDMGPNNTLAEFQVSAVGNGELIFVEDKGKRIFGAATKRPLVLGEFSEIDGIEPFEINLQNAGTFQIILDTANRNLWKVKLEEVSPEELEDRKNAKTGKSLLKGFGGSFPISGEVTAHQKDGDVYQIALPTWALPVAVIGLLLLGGILVSQVFGTDNGVVGAITASTNVIHGDLTLEDSSGGRVKTMAGMMEEIRLSTSSTATNTGSAASAASETATAVAELKGALGKKVAQEPTLVLMAADAWKAQDTDGDGVTNLLDACPKDPAKGQSLYAGCPNPEALIKGAKAVKRAKADAEGNMVLVRGPATFLAKALPPATPGGKSPGFDPTSVKGVVVKAR